MRRNFGASMEAQWRRRRREKKATWKEENTLALKRYVSKKVCYMFVNSMEGQDVPNQYNNMGNNNTVGDCLMC